MMRSRRVPRLAGAALLALLSAPAGAQTLVKLATLVPESSVWDKALQGMGAEWRAATAGRVELRVYPNGVAGDEAEVVRKMRIGQLQAATLSIGGLEDIDEAFGVFGVPFVFDSYPELYAALAALEGELAARLEAKGFVLLHWGHGGWVHLFSKQPIRTIDDLKAQKLWVWAGDDARVQLWRRSGFQPVPLASTDILTGLQTGMIGVVPNPPLIALAFQWFRQLPNMLDLGLAPLAGGTVITRAAWERISPADREALRAAARRTQEALEREVPAQDAEAVEQMRQRGLTVTSPADPAEWRRAGDSFVREVQGNFPAEVFARLLAARDAWRAQQRAAP
ncbi:MAG: TRAP transporter substrate-binding protein DctP [Thermoanaerobaculia bacterium]